MALLKATESLIAKDLANGVRADSFEGTYSSELDKLDGIHEQLFNNEQ